MFSKIKSFLFINKGTGQILAKNTFWLFAGEATGRVLKLSIIIFATRKLGAENWGIFSYALSYIGLFYFLGDFGIGTFVTRELSKDNENKHKYIATALILKVSLLCLFFILTMLIAPHIGKIKLGLDIIIVLSIFFFSESIRDFAIAINRSLEKMEREALSRLIINIVTVILGIFLLIKNKDPLSLAIAYMTGSIISNYFLIWSLSNELKEIKWVFSKEKLKIIYNFSWPIIIMSFFSLIFSIDSIMLGQMKSTTEVGLYSAGQRMVQFLPVFPGFIATAIFPLLSKHEHNIQKSTYIIEKILIIVIAMAIQYLLLDFYSEMK